MAQNSSRVEANAATVCLSPLFALPLLKEQVSATQINVATEVSQKFFRQQERLSFSCNSNRSIARVLVFSVSSLPKRKVMAFASWICCVLRHHLRVKHLFPFFECSCPIRKREQNVIKLAQVLMLADLTCTVFLSQRVDKMTSNHTCQSSQNHPGLVLKSLQRVFCPIRKRKLPESLTPLPM